MPLAFEVRAHHRFLQFLAASGAGWRADVFATGSITDTAGNKNFSMVCLGADLLIPYWKSIYASPAGGSDAGLKLVVDPERNAIAIGPGKTIAADDTILMASEGSDPFQWIA